MRQLLLALVGLVPLLAAPSLARADNAVFACDTLAAHPIDPHRPEGVSGVFIDALEPARAIPACELALEQIPGHPRLQFQLARSLYRAERFPEALNYIRLAAAQGYAPAERNLGHGFYRGKILPLNDALAVRWFRKAAEKGHALAQYDLGKMYERGHGISQDNAQAANWYRKAAEQMFTLAQFSLAYLYQAGSGVPKDRVQGLMWFTIAARLGDSDADRIRELAAFSMSPDDVAKAESMASEWLNTRQR
ncbi:MAG: sel1 repeat family protein [Alphaproteobacteria bacterium]|nr:sel1 repeat family protein [Alphaproteobacteria bacterium]